ncbi:MAG: hypothetical protein ACKPKO_40230 [Candidatus Fonsibacter sp.]
MTTQQLHRNSFQSGLANVSWDEFSGSEISCCNLRGYGAQKYCLIVEVT